MAFDKRANTRIPGIFEFYDNDDDDDDAAPVLHRRNAPTGELLAILLFEEAVTRRQLRRLASEPAFCLMVKAPTAAWVHPIERAMRHFGHWDHAIALTAPERIRAGSDDNNSLRVVDAMADGRRLLGVSQDPTRCLPAAMLAAADVVVDLGHPSNEVIAAAIRRVTGKAPRKLPKDVAFGLDHPEISACIRKGSTARECVDRLVQAARSKRRADPLLADVPEIKDLHGYGEAKEWAENLLVDLEAWKRGEANFSMLERTCVLASNPGLGKSTYVRSLAKSSGLPLIATSVAGWFANSSGHLDGVIKAIDEVFAAANALAPAILFLDEIDAVPNRATISSRGADWWLPVITHLLTLLDGAVSGVSANLVVIGATNHVEKLDAALVRAGRLSRIIHIDRPDQIALEGIFRQHLAGDLADQDLRKAAALALGLTGADVAEIVKIARRVARHLRRPMTIEDLVAVLMPPDHRSPSYLRRVAVHEAGHAVLSHVLGVGEIAAVSIVPRGAGSGFTALGKHPDVHTRADIERRVIYDLAGRASEEVLLGSPSAGAGGGATSDLAKATRIIGLLHLGFGLGDSLVFRAEEESVLQMLALDRNLAAKVHGDLDRLYAQTLDLVGLHRDLIEVVAAELIAVRHLDGEAFGRLIAGYGAPSKKASTKKRENPDG